MSPRARVSLIVAAAATAAAGVTVAATALTSTDVPEGLVVRPRPGAPPLVLDLGVRTDREANDLRRAAGLYERGRRARAAQIFQRHDSVEAQVGAALSAWPVGFGRLQRVARDNPRSGAAQLAIGLGEFWQGKTAEAQASWQRAASAEPDTQYAVRAGDFLHPELPVPGLPVFVPSFSVPAALRDLSPPEQYAFLRRHAEVGGRPRDRILYGVALQRLGRPVSARREYAEAAAASPRDAEALTAAAVGLFDKGQPARAFSRLGPLARRFPDKATVRFHLGLLLVWLGSVEDAKRQFRLAQAAEPGSATAKQAAKFLQRLPGS
jgi:tetratricopeptide (TPR) repeat protein